MNLFGVLEISASGLSAQRQRAEVVTANLANAETTRTDRGGPYRRRLVLFGQRQPGFHMELARAGAAISQASRLVSVRAVVEDSAPDIVRYEPGHPDADSRGYVAYPNINPVAEMVDLMGAVRSYQANAAAVSATKQMIQQSLELLR